jgi:hypothetical protein
VGVDLREGGDEKQGQRAFLNACVSHFGINWVLTLSLGKSDQCLSRGMH